MSWTCSRCATRHETDEERRACKRSEHETTTVAILVLAAIVVLCVAAKITWALFAYGDWTCAFAECRKVFP